jgi:putative resolvase
LLVREGDAAGAAQRVGRLILVKTGAASASTAGVVVYARVSSHDPHADLDRQVARLTAWPTGQDQEVAEVFARSGPV